MFALSSSNTCRYDALFRPLYAPSHITKLPFRPNSNTCRPCKGSGCGGGGGGSAEGSESAGTRPHRFAGPDATLQPPARAVLELCTPALPSRLGSHTLPRRTTRISCPGKGRRSSLPALSGRCLLAAHGPRPTRITGPPGPGPTRIRAFPSSRSRAGGSTRYPCTPAWATAHGRSNPPITARLGLGGERAS